MLKTVLLSAVALVSLPIISFDELGFLAVVGVDPDCRAVCTCGDEVNP